LILFVIQHHDIDIRTELANDPYLIAVYISFLAGRKRPKQLNVDGFNLTEHLSSI